MTQNENTTYGASVEAHNRAMDELARQIGVLTDEIEAAKKALDEMRAATKPVHTINGQPIGPNNPGEYGRTHDMDCPACQNTPFTASPRSETYWAS